MPISWCSCFASKTLIPLVNLPVPQQHSHSKPSKEWKNTTNSRTWVHKRWSYLFFSIYAIPLWSSIEQWNCELVSRKSERRRSSSLAKGKQMSCCRLQVALGGWSSFSKPWPGPGSSCNFFVCYMKEGISWPRAFSCFFQTIAGMKDRK